MVATEVMVTRYRYIDELPTHQGALLQVSSEIRGRLAGGWQAEVGDLFFRAPSGRFHYRGAPKKEDNGRLSRKPRPTKGGLYGCHGLF